MTFTEYRLLLGLLIVAPLFLGYMLGRLNPRIVEYVIYIDKKYEGTIGPDMVTCGTCQKAGENDESFSVGDRK